HPSGSRRHRGAAADVSSGADEPPLADWSSVVAWRDSNVSVQPGGEAMSIKTVLYAASGGSAGQGAAELACRLARRFEAHVEGFHVRADPRQAALAFGDGFGSPVVGDLIERTAEEVAEAAARAKQQFDRSIAAHNLPLRSEPPALKPGETVSLEATAGWREETGYAGDLVPRRGRLFDLVVLGRSERVIDQPHT